MSQQTQPVLKKDVNLEPMQNTYFDTAFQGEYSGSNLIYKGLARPGSPTSAAVWQIAKLTYSGNNVTAIQWPINSSGAVSTDYEFIWDNRASLTYQ